MAVRPLRVRIALGLLWMAFLTGTIRWSLMSGDYFGLKGRPMLPFAIIFSYTAAVALLYWNIGSGRRWARNLYVLVALLHLLFFMLLWKIDYFKSVGRSDGMITM